MKQTPTEQRAAYRAQCLYHRAANTIFHRTSPTAAWEHFKEFSSINAAKYESRQLQAQPGTYLYAD